MFSLPALIFRSLLVTSAALFCMAILPESEMDLTVYHVNPLSAGAIPIDQDTGDIPGDLYFYLGDFLLPEECKNKTAAMIAGFDCGNVERTGDLVVTKVDMVIDKNVSGYMACNLCNGTDPFTQKPCKVGSYICDCQDRAYGCDRTKVGVQDIFQTYAPTQPTMKCSAALHRYCGNNRTDSQSCFGCLQEHSSEIDKATCSQKDGLFFCPSPFGFCDKTGPAWECWRENIPRKTRGYWVSTLREGMCTDSSPPGSCSWKVKETKTVNETCLRNSIMATAEASSPGCFTECGPRNTSSTCWIGCFFDTLLGTSARTSNMLPLGGISLDAITQAWEKAFAPTWKGGCPLVPGADVGMREHSDVVV